MDSTLLNKRAKVAIVMGSQSDWSTLEKATILLNELDVEFTAQVVSAHRTPDRLYEFAKSAELDGYSVIIAGAGGAAHLPGMVAALSALPVIAVPVQSKALNGMDSLLSIVQMPNGVAVATQAIGEAGAYNAGLLAAQIIGACDTEVRARVKAFREKQTEGVPTEVES